MVVLYLIASVVCDEGDALAYRRSLPLDRWLGVRATSLDRVAEAHRAVGEIDGPGRPLEVGRPLARAYIMHLVAEFQGFTRDLYDNAAEALVRAAAPPPELEAMLTRAITSGRQLDAGNATIAALRMDSGRLGIRNLEGKLATRCDQWDKNTGEDAATFKALVDLRNAIAHGNARQVDELRRQGYRDTISWARQRRPMLNRTARALDRIVWDHMLARTGEAPW